MKDIKKFLAQPYPYIFLASYLAVWLGWDALRIPFRNPHGIISALPLQGFNPTNNLIRLAAILLVPPAACYLYWLATQGYWGRLWARRAVPYVLTASLVAVGFFLAAAMGIVQSSTDPKTTENSYGGPYAHALIDTFHEGETLGPAVSYDAAGMVPYKDFIFLHGVFQDPLRSSLAFNLFGRSIGATRTFASLLTVLAFILFLVLLWVLFRGNPFKTTLALSIFSLLMLLHEFAPSVSKFVIGIQLPFRDIATILFLIAAILGFRALEAGRVRWHALAAAAIGFIASAGFANSIDRALYVAALSVVWLLLVWLSFPGRRFLIRTFIWYVLGLIAGIPVLGLALKGAFGSFLKYLMEVGTYKEYLDGLIFQRPAPNINLILILASAGIVYLGYLFIARWEAAGSRRTQGVRGFARRFLRAATPLARRHFIPILLLATGVIFLRSAVGRASIDHFVYSVQWLYLLVIYLVLQWSGRRWIRLGILPGFLTLILLGGCLLLYAARVKKIDVKHDTFPLGVRDQQLVRTDYWETAQYLRQNLRPDETFATLTSEAAWYYLVDKPSPLRFPVIWFAATPKDRQDLAAELAAEKNIKYVVTNNNWTSTFDFVPNQVRFPEVYDVLTRHYTPHTGIGQQTVWIRNPGQ